MPLATLTVGSADDLIVLVGDPSAASQKQSVPGVGDTQNFSALYAALTQNLPMLLNAGGTFDRARSAIGTTGIPAVNTEGSKATYSVGVKAFTPVATATDFWTIVGSATKTGRLLRLKITGVANAAISEDIQLIKRTTANSGGTAAQPAIMQHDSNDAAPTCVVNTYSVNPTTGTGAGVGRSEKLNLGVTGSAGSIEWDWTTRNGKGLVLRGIAEAYCLNYGGAAIPAGMLIDIDCEFSEE